MHKLKSLNSPKKYISLAMLVVAFIFSMIWPDSTIDVLSIFAIIFGVIGSIAAITIPLISNFSNFEAGYSRSIYYIYEKLNCNNSIQLLIAEFMVGFLLSVISLLLFDAFKNIYLHTIIFSLLFYFTIRILWELYDAINLMLLLQSNDSYREILEKKLDELLGEENESMEYDWVTEQLYYCEKFKVVQQADTYILRRDLSLLMFLTRSYEQTTEEDKRRIYVNKVLVPIIRRYIALTKIAAKTFGMADYNNFISLLINFIMNTVLQSNNQELIYNTFDSFYLTAYEQVMEGVEYKKVIATWVLLPVFTRSSVSLETLHEMYKIASQYYSNVARLSPETTIEYHKNLLLSSGFDGMYQLDEKYKPYISLNNTQDVIKKLNNFNEFILDMSKIFTISEKEKQDIYNAIFQNYSYSLHLRMMCLALASMVYENQLSSMLKIYDAHSPAYSQGHNVGFRLIPENPIVLLLLYKTEEMFFLGGMDMGQSKHYFNYVIGVYILYSLCKNESLMVTLPTEKTTVSNIDVGLERIPIVKHFLSLSLWEPSIKDYFKLTNDEINQLRQRIDIYLEDAKTKLESEKEKILTAGNLSLEVFDRFKSEITNSEKNVFMNLDRYPLFASTVKVTDIPEDMLITRKDMMKREYFIGETGIYTVFSGGINILERLHLQTSYAYLMKYGAGLASINPDAFEVVEGDIIFICFEDRGILSETFSQDIFSVITLPNNQKLPVKFIQGGAPTTGKYWIYNPSNYPGIFSIKSNGESDFDLNFTTNINDLEQQGSQLAISSIYGIILADKDIYLTSITREYQITRDGL